MQSMVYKYLNTGVKHTKYSETSVSEEFYLYTVRQWTWKKHILVDAISKCTSYAHWCYGHGGVKAKSERGKRKKRIQ